MKDGCWLIRLCWIFALFAGVNSWAGVQEDKQEVIPEEEAPSTTIYEFFTGARTYYFSDLTSVDDTHPKVDETLVHFGMRLNYVLEENWLLDMDMRAVFLKRHLYIEGLEDSLLYFDIRRLLLLGEYIFDSPFWSLELGRKRLRNNRAWLYDDDMDQVELLFDSTLLDLRFGFAKWLWDGRLGADISARDPDQTLEASGTRYWFIEGEYQWYKSHFFELQFVYEDYKNPRLAPSSRTSSPDPFVRHSELGWIVGSSYGAQHLGWGERHYWLDTGWVFGKRNTLTSTLDGQIGEQISQRMRGGWGLNAGVKVVYDSATEGFAFLYATSQGSNANSQYGHFYVQPVIAGNKSSLLGPVRRRYYGELLAPMLNNLTIMSAHWGFAILNSYWAEMSFYTYQQRHPDPWLFTSRSAFTTNGRSRDIGDSYEVSIGGEAWPEIRLNFILAAWMAGPAFHGVERQHDAYRASIQFEMRL
ncbi:hypothetical protein [Algicola sagamiensis]|uniref:hypothetical protein n=1 Tax=Algicola sagamiensis TaxID=163869 RepID=UPI0003790E5B|nr:hypothetical protein [Algicola sagamiensis]